MIKILLVFGTRPEAIKMAPVYRTLQERRTEIHTTCCVTAQHRELLDQVTGFFGMRADYDLNLLKDDQSLFHVTTGVLEGLRPVIEEVHPDMILVQGDTTSAFAAALASFYLRVPVGHIEAGLRSWDMAQPYPEELNRSLISRIACLNFCPTDRASMNLLKEGIPVSTVHVTGNTVVDALQQTLDLLRSTGREDDSIERLDLPTQRFILVTGHRRENFGRGLSNMAEALLDLTKRFHDISFVYSLHPNPNVQRSVREIIGSHPRIAMIPPPAYADFIALMSKAYLIISDSGGIQEEAPSLKKPVLVTRNVTERLEAVEAGTAVLVGTDRGRIVHETSILLEDPAKYSSMIVQQNPFGDGHAAMRIVDHIQKYLSPNLESLGSNSPDGHPEKTLSRRNSDGRTGDNGL